MAGDNEVHQIIGEHSARLTEMERWRGRMEDRLNARLDAQDRKLDAITSTLDKLSGGWKLLLILGSALLLASEGAVRLYHVFVK